MQEAVRAGEVLRALAAAANALRLYPASSPMRSQAISKFVEAGRSQAKEARALRFTVEPKHFKSADVSFGEVSPQISTLAECLYAHQVKQLERNLRGARDGFSRVIREARLAGAQPGWFRDLPRP